MGRQQTRQAFFIILLIIILAILLGFAWWRYSETRTTPSGGSGGATACMAGTTAYQNTDLDIAFCYPAAWGSVNVSDAKFAGGDAGERWRISFSAKPEVHLGMATTDWSTAVARDGTCVDPGSPSVPGRGAYSTSWQVETEVEGQPSTAYRGLAQEEGEYTVYETVSDLLNTGVCIEGFRTLSLPAYNNAVATYYVDFGAVITTPQQHMDNPETLVPASDREQFTAFVQSIHELE